MIKKSRGFLACLMLILISWLAGACASGNSDGAGTEYLTASLNLQEKHGQYHSLDHGAREIEIRFSLPIKPETVWGNVDLSDKDGSLSGMFDLLVEGRSLFIRLHDQAALRSGWQYTVHVSSRVRSLSNLGLEEDRHMEVRTTAEHLFALQGPGSLPVEKNAIVCFSDVHMGEARAADKGYCWFEDNSTALVDLVGKIQDNHKVKQVVILGDLFDEWLIPHATDPFSGPVTNSREYFRAVADAPLNKPIMDILADIAADNEKDLVYVHGNHDMLLARETLEEILPGALFFGEPRGLGIYEPLEGIVMEHGHRYDFFNAPHSLVNPPHMLPPGYFVSRLWASGMEAEKAAGGETVGVAMPYGDVEAAFDVTWGLTLIYTAAHFPHLDLPSLSDPIIQMTGIDGYAGPFSFDAARDIYADGEIEAEWPDTQETNRVPYELDVFTALLNGHSDLFEAARLEYLGNKELLEGPRIVIFGHTHEPMIEVYQPDGKPAGLYANTGSWVNRNVHGYIGGTPYKVRTFVVLTPGKWTGSKLDVVTLYEYRPDPGGQGFTAHKLAEESLERPFWQ